LAVDSKLRACDLVKLRLDDICSGVIIQREDKERERRRIHAFRLADRIIKGIANASPRARQGYRI
jgi:hypothetical protein